VSGTGVSSNPNGESRRSAIDFEKRNARSIDYWKKIDPPLHANEAASLKKHRRRRS